ncbi:MAG TPA: VWA domain-containing protein, partial [Kofleriaceae bacterium]|nr:VWA domain-containing protein [Kofleriaceae bacterium]
RLREILLLLARILACLAVPLALAKPFTACQAKGPLVERGPQAAVLVVDNSFAAGYTAGDESLLARSRERARRILDQLGPEAEVAVVAAAEGAESPTELSRDHIRLRDQIRAIEASARPADLTSALRRAAQLTSGSSQASRTVYLLGLPGASGLRPGESPWPAERAPRLHVVDPAEGRDLDNVAVTSVEVAPDADSGARGIRVTAEVRNFGDQAVRDRAMALRVEGRVVARGLVTIQPGQAQKKQFTASLPTGARAAEVVVESAEDALAVDDRRHALAVLREEVPILLVNGDPRTVRYEDELFYLSAALRPGDRADSGAVLTATTPDELAGVELDDFAVVVLANVPALPRPQVDRLRRWIEAGGGLLTAVGDNVSVDDYNASMQPLLPQSLSALVDLVHGARGGERQGRALHLAKLDRDHPIFSLFPPDAPGLREAAFSRVVLLGPTTDVADRRVLARYDNGTAALVEARRGQGTLLFFTSSLDRDWNDLPIHPGFVPLVQQAMRHLARISVEGGTRQVLVGQPLLLDVPPGTTRIEVRGPSTRRHVIEGEELAERKQVRFSGTDRPGFYRVTWIAGEGGAADVRKDVTFAVNLDPRGSDLARADLDKLAGQSSARPAAAAAAASHERRVELWHAVAAALLLFLLVESILVWRN